MDDRNKDFELDVENIEVLNGPILVEVEAQEQEKSNIVLLDSTKDMLKHDVQGYLWATVIKIAPDVEHLSVGNKILFNNGVRPAYLPDKNRDNLYLIHSGAVQVYKK